MPRAKKPAAPKAVAPHNTGAPQPPAAPTGMPYGAHQASIASQRALPAAGPTPTAPPAPPPTPTQPPAQPEPAPPGNDALLAAAQGYDPGQPIGLGPTARPGEPVTAGLPLGPGAGAEALNLPSSDVEAWRPYLPALEYMAGQPNSTLTTRNFVRRLRSLMPPSGPVVPGQP